MKGKGLPASLLITASSAVVALLMLGRNADPFVMTSSHTCAIALRYFLLVGGTIAGVLNLQSVYHFFTIPITFMRAARIVLLNFPLLVLQLAFIYAFFVLGALL